MSKAQSTSMFSGRQVSAVVLVVGLIAGVLAIGWNWWNHSSLDPKAVFWGALQNNLATPGVTVTQSATASGTTTAQSNQFDFGPNKRAKTITTFSQDDAQVRTLELSTPTGDFTKYITIQPGKAQVQNAAAIKQVLNIWANTTAAGANKDPSVPSTFPTVLLTLAVPFGGFTPVNQQALLTEMKTRQVYTPDLTSVQKAHVAGHLQYTYKVTMQPILYVQLMKDYATFMGMHELANVDPNSYATTTVTAMTWTVDARSRQLTSISYESHTEKYSGFGLPITDQPPTKTISGTDLQQRVSALQNQIQTFPGQ